MVTLFVLAFLYTKDHVLLIRRCNAKFGNGLYSLVGGKVEPHETALHAIKREVNEEVGLKLPESAFTLVHTFHRKGTETEFIALCFKADITEMQLQNMEPHKHDDLRFFTIKNLPTNILPGHKQAIESIQNHISYSEHGW